MIFAVPLSDDNPTVNPPILTYFLIGACVGAFLWQLGHNERLILYAYGMIPAELFGLWLRKRRRPLTCVTDDDIRVFASRPPLRSLRCTAYSAGRHLIRHLRHRRLVLPPPALFSARIERVVADYDAHLCNVAGLAAATRLYCRRYAREFLHSVFGTGPIRWSHPIRA